MLLRRLELGLITVALESAEKRVEVHFHPYTFDRLKSARSNKKVRHHIISRPPAEAATIIRAAVRAENSLRHTGSRPFISPAA
jgi:hypothetical protein